jgi:hypothetical protein
MHLCFSTATFLMYLVLLTAACVPGKWKGNEILDFHDNQSYVNTPNSYVVLVLPKFCRFISMKYKDIE